MVKLKTNKFFTKRKKNRNQKNMEKIRKINI